MTAAGHYAPLRRPPMGKEPTTMHPRERAELVRRLREADALGQEKAAAELHARILASGGTR